MSEIKAIETYYNGYRFRSRLEARWAVFFDALGVKYEYEPQGFTFDDGTCYLPDFYLPDCDLWIEVKGLASDSDSHKIELFREHHTLIVLGSIPPETDDIVNWAYDTFGDWTYFSTGWDFPYLPCVCPKCGKFGFEFDGRGARVCGNKCFPDFDKGYSADDPRIINAYRAARQARFEHGETPIPF